eukprot:GHVN01079090.1.p1 GENE.GHVN01079090.1~~GHVN01079090.1.p1  ORF type:complete len:379 (-),score=51.49 GHVN01079090.1:271-1407(-)
MGALQSADCYRPPVASNRDELDGCPAQKQKCSNCEKELSPTAQGHVVYTLQGEVICDPRTVEPECDVCRNIKSCPNVSSAVEALEEQKRKQLVLSSLDCWDVATEYKGTMVQYFTKNPDALDSITGNTNDCLRPESSQPGEQRDLPEGVVIWQFPEVQENEAETTTEISIGSHRVEVHPRCEGVTATKVEQETWLEQECHAKAYNLIFKGKEDLRVEASEGEENHDPDVWVSFTSTCPRTHIWIDGIALHFGPLVKVVIFPNGSIDDMAEEAEDRKIVITSVAPSDTACGKCGKDPNSTAAKMAQQTQDNLNQTITSSVGNGPYTTPRYEYDDLFDGKYEPFEEMSTISSTSRSRRYRHSDRSYNSYGKDYGNHLFVL